jgi:hypothetical protein
MDRVYGGSQAQSTGSLNPGRRLGDLWLTVAGASPLSASFDRSRALGHHGRQLERAQARATVHHLWWGFILRDLCNERNPICPLTVVETIEGKPATRERLGQASTAVGMALRLHGLLWQRRCRWGLLLQATNQRRRPWQGGSMVVDG